MICRNAEFFKSSYFKEQSFAKENRDYFEIFGMFYFDMVFKTN